MAWGEGHTGLEGLRTALPDGTRRMTEAGGFHAVKVRPEGVQAILKSAAVTRAVEAKTRAMTQFAQSISITKDAYYEAKVLYKDHPTWPARGFVVAENFKAVIDDMYHATLLKTAAHFPSDAPVEHYPLPEYNWEQPRPTAKAPTRTDGLWKDSNNRWRNQKGHFAAPPEE